MAHSNSAHRARPARALAAVADASELSTYRRLDAILPEPLPPLVAGWVSRARAAGIATATGDYEFDPVATYGLPADPDERERWAPVLAAAGRIEHELPDVYPLGASPDEDVPLHVALDDREATGDSEAYELALQSIVEDEPRDVDAHVHLGHLYLEYADNPGAQAGTRRSRADLVQSALSRYLAAVAIGELALPDPFTGLLLWTDLDNRPFLRALHGLALASWDLRRTPLARAVLANMLWLNPLDNQGARIILADVDAGLRRGAAMRANRA